MQEIKRFAARPFDENETGTLSKRVTNNLMAAFDLGKRDPVALHRAALEGIAASADSSA